MKNFSFILAMILCNLPGAGLLLAQQINQGAAAQQPSSLLINDLMSEEGNSAFIKQIGDDNELELTQEYANSAAANLTRVLQSGDYNIAVMHQSGIDNQSILIQDGQNNYYHLVLEGSNNKTAILQLGDDNSIVQKLINTNQVNVELVQEGNHNQIIHILEGIQSKNYQIIQKGDNLKIEIRQSSY